MINKAVENKQSKIPFINRINSTNLIKLFKINGLKKTMLISKS